MPPNGAVLGMQALMSLALLAAGIVLVLLWVQRQIKLRRTQQLQNALSPALGDVVAALTLHEADERVEPVAPASLAARPGEDSVPPPPASGRFRGKVLPMSSSSSPDSPASDVQAA